MGFQGQVPLALENVPLRAVLTGAPTAERRKRVLSSCEVRRAQVSEWLDWYTVHNKYVRSAAKSGENLASLPERDTRPAAVVTCDWKNAGTELGCGAEAGVGTAEEEHEESSHDILVGYCGYRAGARQPQGHPDIHSDQGGAHGALAARTRRRTAGRPGGTSVARRPRRSLLPRPAASTNVACRPQLDCSKIGTRISWVERSSSYFRLGAAVQMRCDKLTCLWPSACSATCVSPQGPSSVAVSRWQPTASSPAAKPPPQRSARPRTAKARSLTAKLLQT